MMTKKLNIGFILIRLFIIIGCFVFVLGRDEFSQRPIVFMKNIGFQNIDIDFDVRYCDDGICRDRGNYSYIVDEKLKNNMGILIYENLIQKVESKIFLKMNGVRIIKGDKVISEYYKKIGLFGSNYDDYASYKKMFLKYLETIKEPIDAINVKFNGDSPIIYSVYFPTIKGSIITTKTKTNNGLYFYNNNMRVIANPVIITSDLDGNNYSKKVLEIDKLLFLDFSFVAKRDDLKLLFYDLMQDVSSEISYALVNVHANSKYDEKPSFIQSEDREYEEPDVFANERYEDMGQIKASHFFTMGVNAIPFKVSLGAEYKVVDNYSHYFNALSFGYNKNMIDLYDIFLSVNINIGKKDYLIIDEKYSFKDPALLSINADLSKRIYFNPNIYIAPLVSVGFSKISSSEAKGFKKNSFLQDTSVLLGGELGFSRNNHEIVLWLKKSLYNASNIIEGSKTYSAKVSQDVSFGMSYGYSF